MDMSTEIRLQFWLIAGGIFVLGLVAGIAVAWFFA
jgi:hypothetical protein